MVAWIDRALYRIMRWVTMASFVALLLLLTAVVLVRFVPVMSMGWSDELVELAFAWMVFLGAAALWRDGSHFRVDMIPVKLEGSRAGRALEMVLAVLSLGFLVVFTYEAWVLMRTANDRTPIFVLSKVFWYGVMPFSGAVMIAYTVRDLVALVRRRASPVESDGR